MSERKNEPDIAGCPACLYIQHAAHGVRRLFLRRCRDMGVGVLGEAGGELAEHTGDRLDVHTIPQCQCCGGVAQVMEADRGNPGPIQHSVRHVPHTIRRDWLTIMEE